MQPAARGDVTRIVVACHPPRLAWTRRRGTLEIQTRCLRCTVSRRLPTATGPKIMQASTAFLSRFCRRHGLGVQGPPCGRVSGLRRVRAADRPPLGADGRSRPPAACRTASSASLPTVVRPRTAGVDGLSGRCWRKAAVGPFPDGPSRRFRRRRQRVRRAALATPGFGGPRSAACARLRRGMPGHSFRQRHVQGRPRQRPG